MAIEMMDADDKRTDELLKEVAQLQEFEAIPDHLSEVIGGDEAELDLTEMDMVTAARFTHVPNYEKFSKKLHN